MRHPGNSENLINWQNQQPLPLCVYLTKNKPGLNLVRSAGQINSPAKTHKQRATWCDIGWRAREGPLSLFFSFFLVPPFFLVPIIRSESFNHIKMTVMAIVDCRHLCFWEAELWEERPWRTTFHASKLNKVEMWKIYPPKQRQQWKSYSTCWQPWDPWRIKPARIKWKKHFSFCSSKGLCAFFIYSVSFKAQSRKRNEKEWNFNEILIKKLKILIMPQIIHITIIIVFYDMRYITLLF